MPRNGSSIYSLPAGNPVIPGTVIATAWANSTLSDIATALTNSLSTDGSTASVSLANKILVGGTLNGPTITGNLTLTGGQITFPAVQSASANVNCLDDYEEGTFTPSISYATPGNLVVNYSTRSGTYTKIGRYVWMNFAMVTTTYTHTTAAGTMIITGAPFTPVSDGQGTVTYEGMLISTSPNYAPPILRIQGGSTAAALTKAGINSNAQVDLDPASHTTGVNVTFLGSIAFNAAT